MVVDIQRQARHLRVVQQIGDAVKKILRPPSECGGQGLGKGADGQATAQNVKISPMTTSTIVL